MPPTHESDYSILGEIEPAVTAFKFSEETRGLIESGWKKVIAERPDDLRDGLLFDRPLLRVSHISRNGNSLQLQLAEDVSYKDVVGLRAQEFLGKIPAKDIFQVASIILIAETGDGSVLLRERNSGDWPHSYELPGGFITSSMLQAVQGDVSQLAKYIAKKELGIDTGDIESLEFVDAFQFEDICECIQAFRIKITPNFIFPDSAAVTIRPSKAPLTEELPLPLHLPSRRILEAI